MPCHFQNCFYFHSSIFISNVEWGTMGNKMGACRMSSFDFHAYKKYPTTVLLHTFLVYHWCTSYTSYSTAAHCSPAGELIRVQSKFKCGGGMIQEIQGNYTCWECHMPHATCPTWATTPGCRKEIEIYDLLIALCDLTSF